MLKFKIVSLFPFVLPLLFLSCWGDSSPTSDKSKTFKISGSITDKNGAGIEGVAVQIAGSNFSSTDATDSGGNFEFKGIPSGSYTIKTSAGNRVFKPSGIDVTVSDSDIDTIEFTEAENRIHGQVIDIITNKGMTDIKISLYNELTHSETDSSITDSDGFYEFFDVPSDEYRFSIDSRILNLGNYYASFRYINPDAFTVPEISGPIFFISSEILQITAASFSEDTNTVYLEWTASKSNFCSRYIVTGQDKFPFGGAISLGGLCDTNSAFIEITEKYRKLFNNPKILYFAVLANYSAGLEPYGMLNSLYSEPVSVQVAE